jgi:hypothetical protein
VEQPSVRDTTDVERQMSPWASQRRWERQAEDNILERLERAALLAPAGEVDRVLETIASNLVVTNHLQLEPPVRCRILMTTPFESFTIGRTIVISRGLIDVLPTESSLAIMLAHELGHVLLGHRPVDTRYSFSNRMMLEDSELLYNFRFERSEGEEKAADAKAVELLGRSPYADKLSEAGLVLRAVASRAKDLPSLIRPHLGDRIAARDRTVRLTELMRRAPELDTRRSDQIAALPLGGRIVIDPWSGSIEILKASGMAGLSVREKRPFEVMPLQPYLRYLQQPGRAVAAAESTASPK